MQPGPITKHANYLKLFSPTCQLTCLPVFTYAAMLASSQRLGFLPRVKTTTTTGDNRYANDEMT